MCLSLLNIGERDEDPSYSYHATLPALKANQSMKLTLVLRDTKNTFIPTKVPYKELVYVRTFNEFPNKFSNFIGRIVVPNDSWNFGVWLDDQRGYLLLMTCLCGSFLFAAVKVIKKLRRAKGGKFSKISPPTHEVSIEISTGRPENTEPDTSMAEEDTNLNADSATPPHTEREMRTKKDTTKSQSREKKKKKATRPKKE